MQPLWKNGWVQRPVHQYNTYCSALRSPLMPAGLPKATSNLSAISSTIPSEKPWPRIVMANYWQELIPETSHFSQYSKSHNRVTKKVYILAVCTTITKTSKRDKLSHESKALLDILLELGQASIEQFLFLRRDRTNRVDLVNTVELCTNISITRIINYKKVVRTPSSTFDEKKSMPWSAKRGDLTKVGVITPFSPFKPLNSRLVNLAPA